MEVSTVLKVTGLRAEYRSRGQNVVAAKDVSFSVLRGGCVALVGESGSGKTTIARVIVGLHAPLKGEVQFRGESLSGLAKHRSIEQRRGIQIVFQNPSDALNPRHSVEVAIARPARLLRNMDRNDASKEVLRLLDAVRLPSSVARRYPTELSGGERQRVAIARALAAGPEILVCDEISSSLDVSVQAVVLELLRDIRVEFGLSIVFITHDLGVVATVADRVLVLESGLICEEGNTLEVMRSPRHIYTRKLLDAAPSLIASINKWDSDEDRYG
jgi:peptide/nickel transport system ATP-binding protein